jgi:hypothetical protein
MVCKKVIIYVSGSKVQAPFDRKFKFLHRMTQNLPLEEIFIAQNNNSNVASLMLPFIIA